jgi:acyl carrier protein
MLVKDRVIQLIIEHLELEPEKVVPEAQFIDDLGISSMDLWELVLIMEDEFNIEVPDKDLEKIRTIQNAIDYIEQRVGKEIPD